MRMTRRASVISTKGVTLIAAIRSSSLLAEVAMLGPHRFEVRHHFAAETLGARQTGLDDPLKAIEERDRWNRDHDADRRRDECFSDLGHESRADLAAGRIELGERANDSD